MKKKVLYVITKSVWGGAQKYVYDLATNLPKDRFEAVVVTGGKGSLVDKLEDAHVRAITLPTLQEKGGIFEVLFSFINVRALFALIKIFRQEKPDVIHLNSSKIGGIGGVAARIYKLSCTMLRVSCVVKVVFTVHGWPHKESRPLWQRAIIFFLSLISTIFQSKVILINNADYKTALKFVPLRKCELIFNGIGEINFLPREEARQFFAQKISRPINSSDILIGTIAELIENKGIPILISALSRRNLDSNYRGFASIVIGEGNERKQLQTLINSSGLSDTVYLPGAIPDAHRYLKGFDVFVLPSLKEGLPYTIMEAMAAGVPVAATRVGGIPDLIEHEKEGLLVHTSDAGALSVALTRLTKEDSLRELLSKKAVQKIKNQFRSSRMIQKTISVYEKT